jgi:hypothetical protein
LRPAELNRQEAPEDARRREAELLISSPLASSWRLLAVQILPTRRDVMK